MNIYNDKYFSIHIHAWILCNIHIYIYILSEFTGIIPQRVWEYKERVEAAKDRAEIAESAKFVFQVVYSLGFLLLSIRQENSIDSFYSQLWSYISLTNFTKYSTVHCSYIFVYNICIVKLYTSCICGHLREYMTYIMLVSLDILWQHMDRAISISCEGTHVTSTRLLFIFFHANSTYAIVNATLVKLEKLRSYSFILFWKLFDETTVNVG